jgi:hypothetical protein
VPSKDESLIRRKGARTPIILGELADSSLPTKSEKDFQTDFIARSERPAGFLHFEGHHNPLVINNDVVRFAMSGEGESWAPPVFARMLAEKAGVHHFDASHYIA